MKARAQELEAQQAIEQVRAQDMAEERKTFELERDEWLKERIRDREEWDRERSEWNQTPGNYAFVVFNAVPAITKSPSSLIKVPPATCDVNAALLNIPILITVQLQ